MKGNMIKALRNQIFYSLDKSEFPKNIPLEVLKLFSAHTTPKDVESLRGTCKTWKTAATCQEQILSINTGLRLVDCLPPKIKTTKEALEWLEKDAIACRLLKYADFTYLKDFKSEDLAKLIEICPHLTHLFIYSSGIDNVEKLPAKLQVLQCCRCPLLVSLPDLPATLQVLQCSLCPLLASLPDLPAALSKLYCFNCPLLVSLPVLPATLQELSCIYCNLVVSLPKLPAKLRVLECHNCPLLVSLPDLPATLQLLNCHDCPMLVSLPNLQEMLQVLACHDCPLLVSLPELPPTLQVLECYNCPKLSKESDLKVHQFRNR